MTVRGDAKRNFQIKEILRLNLSADEEKYLKTDNP
jgi:hypothetical protein